jgi:hypothetical protein
MQTSNDDLKVLLHDAKLACRSKFIQLVQHTGNVSPKLEEILRLIKGTFKEFDRSNLWQEPIEYDEFLLIEHTLTLNETPGDDIVEFEKVVKAFLTFLRDDILKEPLSRLNNVSAQAWNDRVLSALVNTRRRIGIKKAVFKRKGINLNNDPRFRETAKKQNSLTRKYIDALNNNTVDSTEKDKKILDGYSNLFNTVATVKRFKALFDRFTKYLEGKVPTA